MNPNPNAPANEPVVNHPLMEYNNARLEMLALAMKLRVFLLHMSQAQQNDFRNEICSLFREFNRAFPTANLPEYEGMRLVMALGEANERAGSYAEFAGRIAPHTPLVQAFRKLTQFI